MTYVYFVFPNSLNYSLVSLSQQGTIRQIYWYDYMGIQGYFVELIGNKWSVNK